MMCSVINGVRNFYGFFLGSDQRSGSALWIKSWRKLMEGESKRNDGSEGRMRKGS